LPEQSHWSGDAAQTPAATRAPSKALYGTTQPHWSAPASSPIFASIAATSDWWCGSPEWDAQQSANSRGVNPKRSAAPLSTTGIAWNGLAEDR